MKIIRSIFELTKQLIKLREHPISIGFIPTMGALHNGHISLVEEAKKKTQFVICSIFVNPTQFNNKEDLALYPQTEKEDLKLLADNKCDLVFIPCHTDIYDSDYHFPFLDLGSLGSVMEGEFRPGHFHGVCQVVYRFFDIIKPSQAFFGLKDFQQVSIIRFMTNHFNIPVEIIACETKRNGKGLALSSRNLLLSITEQENALFLFKSLELAKTLAMTSNPLEVKKQVISYINSSPLRLEYVEIINPEDLSTLSHHWVPKTRICIVAYSGTIRLIDNMEITD